MKVSRCEKCGKELKKHGATLCRTHYLAACKKVKDDNRKRSRDDVAFAEAVVADHMLTARCVDCGCDDRTVLYFDPQDRESGEPTIAWTVNHGRSMERVRAAIAKHDVCCLNCLARRTSKRFQDAPEWPFWFKGYPKTRTVVLRILRAVALAKTGTGAKAQPAKTPAGPDDGKSLGDKPGVPGPVGVAVVNIPFDPPAKPVKAKTPVEPTTDDGQEEVFIP